MSKYQMAVAVFWKNKNGQEDKYDLYDYFSLRQGINSINTLSQDGFEIKEIKMAMGRTAISELLNECVNFKEKSKKPEKKVKKE